MMSIDYTNLLNKTFVFISGYARSGKDTVAEMIVEELKANGKKAKKFAFADILKDEVCQCLGISREQLDLFKNESKEGRRLLQSYGESKKYFLGKYYWVSNLLDKVAVSDCEYVIISDYRFTYESDFVDDFGLKAAFVKVVRDSVQVDNHISENGLENVAFPNVIENNDSFDVLKRQVDSFVVKILS
jgi:hypothetical protein